MTSFKFKETKESPVKNYINSPFDTPQLESPTHIY